MESDSSIVPLLFMVTLVLAIAIGVWQLWRVKKARQEHHRSAAAKANHEPPVQAGVNTPPR